MKKRRKNEFGNFLPYAIFIFGGAQSHDAPGGIFDRDDPDYGEKVKRAKKKKKPYRVKNLTWWEQELPTQEEMEEGRKNLNALDYQVDYVITHCASGRIQDLVLKGRKKSSGFSYEKNYLTEYFDWLEETLVYRHWYFGHYHEDREIDDKHTLLYYEVIPLS